MLECRGRFAEDIYDNSGIIGWQISSRKLQPASPMSSTEAVGGSVIGRKSVVMGSQLDIQCGGLIWVEASLIIFYILEVAVKFKRFGISMCWQEDDWAWYVFDFIIVVAGVLDLIQLSLWKSLTYEKVSGDVGVAVAPRMVRLLCVLGLVKLWPEIKPLHLLLSGVAEAVISMQWVMLLTSLVVYGSAIVF